MLSFKRLNSVIYSYGTYLALTGRRVTGEEAINLGMATHFVHSSRLPVSHFAKLYLLIKWPYIVL